ncbi:deoxyribodipyrimidine photo-lyase type I [Acidothermus cellulolyticus 11B]|uniref:Deoxyribodipyrimidine photo-lyase type I n=1 Tax=Acidothermus cellulolyticus (strain ATCC 43068 / DSM 8971 / 11B) TaxID=351607 RepID=A0LR66_ACIC1|nr:deoxyribodipyrimidine photo-lyase type I [Acidothermus cellulolyticus 11B]
MRAGSCDPSVTPTGACEHGGVLNTALPPTKRPIVYWFRRDLRLADSPALVAAARAAGAEPIVPLFVVDPRAGRGAGPNRWQFLASCLEELDRQLGGALTLRRAPGVGGAAAVAAIVAGFAAEVGAEIVVASGETTPYGRRRDRIVAERLAAEDRRLLLLDTPYCVAPGRLRRTGGHPYRVFSAFYRAWLAEPVEAPYERPAARFDALVSDGEATDLVDAAGRGYDVSPSWWRDLPLGPAPHLPAAGERAAIDRLTQFCESALPQYDRHRDRPDMAGTSRLSADLHFGTLHPRTVRDAARKTVEGPALDRFLAELAWREFFADVLWHRPDAAWHSWDPIGRHLAVDDGPQARERFTAWARGETGYGLVDAGMRQLLSEGWMHNRVRMVSASFLVKDLHLDWRWGARWFLWHLVDGDIASNNLNWQWVAGIGTDAAPYHRIFNPDRQAERFDPDGAYRRRYCADLPARLSIVNHKAERAEALTRWAAAKAAVRHESTAD